MAHVQALMMLLSMIYTLCSWFPTSVSHEPVILVGLGVIVGKEQGLVLASLEGPQENEPLVLSAVLDPWHRWEIKVDA